MRRTIPIRITQNDREEYKRLVRNSKAKIRRANKKYGVDLSDEVELPKLGNFSTREEFNQWKEETRSFTNRANQNYQFVKNDYGVVASKKKIHEIENATKEAQRLAIHMTENATNKPFISGDKVQGTVGQRMMQMGKPNVAGITIPKNFDFSKVRNQQRLEQIEQNMVKRSNPKYFDKRLETMKQNFMDILQLSFNSDADELIEKLKGIPTDDFYEMYLMFDEFDFDLYSSENIGAIADEGNIKKMLSYIDRYYRGDIDFNLKGF
jgi:hypothetical protein